MPAQTDLGGMKAIFIRLFFTLITLGACTLAMTYLGPWAFLLNEHAPPNSRAAALGDLDGDGDLDAFLANGKSESQAHNTLWANQGGVQKGQPGRFTPSDQELGLGEFNAAAPGDLDQDGDLDLLAVAGYGIKIFMNQGGQQGGIPGVFQFYGPDIEHGEGYGFQEIALGDLDGDDDPDIFAADCCGAIVSRDQDRNEWWPSKNTVWLNTGPEKGLPPLFRDSGQRLGTDGTMGVALGDMDGDGDLDAFTANASSLADVKGNSSTDQPDRVWLNDGAGNFTDSGQRLGGDEGQSVALGDLDHDGDLDAFVGSNGPDFVWLNDGAGRFAGSDQRLGEEQNRAVFLGDLDGDRDLDALVVNRTEAEFWLNDGQARFSPSDQQLEFSGRHALALGDLDGDGDLDVFAGWLDRDYRVWLNDGAGQYKLLE